MDDVIPKKEIFGLAWISAIDENKKSELLGVLDLNKVAGSTQCKNILCFRELGDSGARIPQGRVTLVRHDETRKHLKKFDITSK
jgi:hypothetical protein